MKKKRIVAIGRKSPTFDELIVDPSFCPHLNVVNVMPSNPTSPQDADEPYAQCLDCNFVLHDDGTWGPLQDEINTDEIPY